MRPRCLEEPAEEGDRCHGGPGFAEDELPWSDEILQRVVKALFASIDGPVDGDVDRKIEGLLGTTNAKWVGKIRKGRQRLGEVGESGMYM